MTFCHSINNLPISARLHKALSRYPKIELGSLVAPSGMRMQSKGEALEPLLATHFPKSIVIEGMPAPAAAHRARWCNWRVAAKFVTCQRVEWAINSFAPYKSLGMDRIFPALLQEGWSTVIPYLVTIFCSCLATGCVQAIWHQFKRVFIPKTGRSSYTGPRDFRHISLTWFLLNTTERLVDRYLRDWTLAVMPLHLNQHACQAGKSMTVALHHLMVWVVKALNQQGVFLDIKGEFNYTSFDSMCDAHVSVSEMGLATPLSGGLELPWRATWPQRLLMIHSGRLQHPGDARSQGQGCFHQSCGASLLMIK